MVLIVFNGDFIPPKKGWWNLLPASRQISRVKRDRLVFRPTLLVSRDHILYYLQLLRSGNERRINLELERSLIHSGTTQDSWETAAFAGLAETVETIVLKRGLQRWSA